ncbi:MAG: CoA transferase [Chloroflexi bacterium]|nr:CoA transferase [Chloroflexota bacterium]
MPLSGLSVLELAQGVAGPYCGRLLAEQGAMVVKVEPPAGDYARRLGPFPPSGPHPERSALYLWLNAGKQGVTLDAGSATGRALLRRLAAQAQVVVARPDAASLAALAALDEAPLVRTTITWFGADGPYRDYRGGELAALASGGLLGLTGEPGREPLAAPGPQAQYQAGLAAAVATVAAVLRAEATGQPQRVEVSVQAAVASLLEGAILGYGYTGRARGRMGSRHPAVYPSGIYPCQDGYIHVHAPGDWGAFARWAGLPERADWAADPQAHAEEIEPLLSARLRGHTRDELFRQGQEWRFPLSPVLSLEEVLADPQHQARGYFQEVEHPAAGRFPMPGPPFRLEDAPPPAPRPAPMLGQHNAEVYGALGCSSADLVRLREAGVI